MAINPCPHKGKFFCTTVSVGEGKTYAYACIERCGFWMNFNPVNAGTVRDKPVKEDIIYDSWNLLIMAFHPHPNPQIDWKASQPMAQEGTKMGRGEAE